MINNESNKFDLKDFLLNIKILRHVSEFPREQWSSFSGHSVRRFNEGILVFILRFATKRTLRHNILWPSIFVPSRQRKSFPNVKDLSN